MSLSQSTMSKPVFDVVRTIRERYKNAYYEDREEIFAELVDKYKGLKFENLLLKQNSKLKQGTNVELLVLQKDEELKQKNLELKQKNGELERRNEIIEKLEEKVDQIKIKLRMPESMFGAFRSFRETNVCCDITLKTCTGTKEYPCHKVILASESLYFQEIFDGTSTGTSEFMRLKMEESILEKFLNIVYRQSTQSSNYGNDAIDLIFAASYFRTRNIADAIENFIIEKNFISGTKKVERLFKLCYLPDLADRPKLHKYVRKHVLANFQQISQKEEFYEFSFEMLENNDLLVNPELFESPSIHVNFLGKWVYYRLSRRIGYVDNIIDLLNVNSKNENSFSSMILSQSENVSNEELLRHFVRTLLQGLLIFPMEKKYNQVKKRFCNDSSLSVVESESDHDSNYSNWQRCEKETSVLSEASSEISEGSDVEKWEMVDNLAGILYGQMISYTPVNSENNSDYES